MNKKYIHPFPSQIISSDFGYFSFGSTVILCIENIPDFIPSIVLNNEVGKRSQQ